MKNWRQKIQLTDETLIRNLPFVVWIALLTLISIYVGHKADTKVHLIDELSERRQLLEAEHTETKEKLTKLSLESRVVRRAEALGLQRAEDRPEKIVVEP